ncbi:MAG: phage tail protein [Oscillospiraceae bacterium]|nr:phage tail protein [Oscillospiraceae bacterium]
MRKNIAEVLLDSDVVNSFRSRWGGEIIRDRFHISMQSVVGSDNGVSIHDKKNLTGYRSNVDFGTVVTRIMPQGFDGLFIPEKYVDSPLIGNYLTPRIRVIKYENVKAEDFSNVFDAHNMLRNLAQKEYSENHIDRPNATYNIEFAPLQNVEEYRDFAVLESISMGDVVRVIHEEDGLDISARMVGYRYNPLTGAYITITLGNFTPKFTDISRSLKRIETDVNQAQDSANLALKSANGKNTNYYGDVTPEIPRIGDLWFKENGEKTEIWIYETRDEITQWFPLSTDLTQEEMRLELEEAKELVDVAVEKSEEAVEAGEKATKAADEAKAESVVALLTANIAFDTAVDAIVKIGVQFIVKEWFQGNIENGSETDSKAHLRSGYIDVNVGENYIAQFPDGESPLTTSYHYFRASTYIDFVPIPRQMSEWYSTGKYPTYASIIPDLNARNFENANITESVILNSYTGQGDLLIVYRIPLSGRAVPKVIHWLGRKDVSDNAVFLLSNGEWSQIGMITESGANIIHEWELTESQRNGITSGNVHIAFFAIKQGAWAGVYNASTSPFTLNPNSASEKLVEYLSTETSSNAVTVPQNAIKMRVSVSTTIPPTDYKGNFYAANSRADYRNSVYSAILQQTDLINLRVAKGDVINQINISTEGILIAEIRFT